jgi:acetyltransferase-like isoleucine patch superfamily enzyme
MNKYFDKTIFYNPLFEYFKWIKGKIYYQSKYWGKHLRISYKCFVYKCRFGKYNWLGNYSQLSNTTMGDFTYCGDYCVISNAVIGKFCSIGPNVRIAPGKHPTSKYTSTHPSTYNNQPNFVKNFVSRDTYINHKEVNIGNDVWIGANCVIVDGITIGDGAIVAANSVVNKHLEAYEIVGGVPAKFIRKRFNDNEIETLLKIKWWDKSEDWIQDNIAKFWSVDEFVNFQDQFEN